MNLQTRVAVVTGAGAGLGRAHALFLARYGAQVVVNDVDQSAAARVADDIVAAGGAALPVAASVTDEAQIAALVASVMAQWGRVDILINNAGILRDKTFAKMSLADFRHVIDVHLMGSVICTKAVWEIMRQQQYGRVVMTTSSSGLYGNFGQSNYSAAKMALVGLMQTLALEGAKYNIRVNCLSPSAATQMTQGILTQESLERLDPKFVSPGLLALVGDDAPSRAILCAGAGHFARAHVTLTRGRYVGSDAHAGERVIAHWEEIGERAGDLVPTQGFEQSAREVASANAAAAE
jgi:NAD(P)-dependent dehydrogenase (short-subunit alcohol dehydrogenase family)